VRPLASLSLPERRSLIGLVADIDDTILDHGSLAAPTFAALHRARDAGLSVVLATGRPAGWGDVLARMWPVDGVVTENGAIAARREGSRVVRHDPATVEQRRERRRRVEEAAAAILARWPVLRLADDVPWRLTDITFDVGENERVAPELVAEIAAFARAGGATTTVSSVHLHVSYDPVDKASGAVRFLARVLGYDATAARRRFAFVGDSGNDRSCFAAFACSIGVANVARSVPSLSVPPSYVTASERGAGFVEVIDALVAARGIT
jgi:HAD superfamily hydrolase (TIGR01484 family)